MTTIDLIRTLFYRVDNHMRGVAKRSQALLYPSESVTIGILYALKGCGGAHDEDGGAASGTEESGGNESSDEGGEVITSDFRGVACEALRKSV